MLSTGILIRTLLYGTMPRNYTYTTALFFVTALTAKEVLIDQIFYDFDHSIY